MGRRGWGGDARTLVGVRLAVISIAISACLAAVPSANAAPSIERAPTNTEPPSISGTAKAGEILTANPGSWTEEPTAFTYRWESCGQGGSCLLRQESMGAIYEVQPADAYHQLKLTVTASNALGSNSASAPPVEVELAWHYGTGPPRLEPASFIASRPRPPWSISKALGIGIDSGMCVGEGRPSIGHVDIQERGPTTTLPHPSVIVTASVLFPAPTEVVGTVNPGEVGPGCAGVGIGLARRIRLRRPSSRLYVYDGSRSPPRLVLEPAKILHWRKPRVLGPRSIEISVPFSGCAGMSITAHAVERSGRAIITAYGERRTLRRPRPCQKGYGVERVKLELKDPVESTELLDGSFSSPRLRQPLPGRLRDRPKHGESAVAAR